jgi:hypothetical protein
MIYAARMTPRGYSRAFPVRPGTGRRYLLDNIPPRLWRDVRQQARREGVSLRALLLTLLETWLRGHA